jgi:hypothetical protein
LEKFSKFSPVLQACVWAFLAIGTVARALPLFDLDGRALRQFPSEDGYLMLTIARNLAIGNGPSIEAGTTLTNGTQPFMTGVYAGLFWLVGGDKPWGVVLVQVLGITIALLSAFVLYRIGSILFANERNGAALAAVAAAAWYAATLGTRYTQNCLETGAATLLPMVIVLFSLQRDLGPDRAWSLRRCVTLGALLGVAFWVRNDSVFLTLAVCSVLVLSGFGNCAPTVGRRTLEAGCIGITALLIVFPWLLFNHSSFGHIVPISGIKQAGTVLGGNLIGVPAILAEQVSIAALIPQPWEKHPFVVVACSVLLLLWVALAYRETREVGRRERKWLTVVSVWAGLLIGFYGVIYGAGYFLGRYLFPLSTWVALLTVWLAHRLWLRARIPFGEAAAGLALAGILVLSIGLGVRAHRRGMNNGHFQVVGWVEEHVPDTSWVGAIQSGTLGFFHDRTYNLDGKVSPAALRARSEERIFEYLLERPTMYLVDWVGIATWLDDPRLGRHFDLLLLDEAQNLAVLRRRHPVGAPAS